MTFTLQHSTDRREKIIALCEVQYVSHCTGGQTFLQGFWAIVHGHKDDPCSRIPAQDQARSRDAIESGHGDIGDDDIGGERSGSGNERVAISNSGHHLEIRYQGRVLKSQTPLPTIRYPHASDAAHGKDK